MNCDQAFERILESSLDDDERAANEPAYLPVGTDVSAKYRGAFCEAKVKKLARLLKCKVMLKETQTAVIVTDENLKGNMKVGATVEIKHPDTSQIMEGVISKLTDQSMYTVVFDDGDEKTLRRTQLCLKGEKHFIESETLDNLPLSHPEHFGTPVLQTKSRKRTAKTGSPGFNTIYLAQEDTESEESSSEDSSPKRASYRGRQQELVGKVMVLEMGDKRKVNIIPVLVVLPDAANVDLKTRDHLLVRSFKDGKFLSVLKKELKDFTRDTAIKNEDKNLKTAMEKGLLFFDNHELPSSWKRDELLGSDDEDDIDDDDSSDDEPSEEKDRFVAQLYKFMDDRGTPINKGPCIGTQDLNLYKLFRVVQNLGGYNRVTNQMKWRLIYSKMGLPQSNTASHQIKNAYKKFLHAFEDFYRKLGSTMGTISRPGRSRQNSGRSILSFRSREKDSPKSPRIPKVKESEKDVKSKSDGDSQSDEGKSVEDEKDEASAGKEVSDLEPQRKERTTPRRMLRDDLKEIKEKEKEAKRKKEEEQSKSKKEDKDDVKSKKEEKEDAKSKKEEKEEKEERKGKKEDKKQMVDEERKLSRREKQLEEKAESKKEEVKSNRETRGTREKQKDESKPEKEKSKKKEKDKDKEKEKEKEKDKEKEEEKEEEKPEEEDKSGKKHRITRRKSGRGDEGKKEEEERAEELSEKKVEDKKVKEETPRGKKEDKKDTKKGDDKDGQKDGKDGKKEEKDAKKDEKDAKNEDKDAKKADKVEEMSEDKKAEGIKEDSMQEDDKLKEKKLKEKKNKEKEKTPSSQLEEEESEEDDDDEPEDSVSLRRTRDEYPSGTKLKVRYGRGRNQKVYEAKVVESNKDGSHKSYLVHYAGWNNRYDEWVKADRIISVVNKPDSAKSASKKISPKTPSPKQMSAMLKKRGRPPTGVPSSPGSTPSTATEFRTPPPKSRSPAPGNGQPGKARPTRSNSVENQVADGAQPKRLTRRSSGITESSDTVSHGSDESGDYDSDEGDHEKLVVDEEEDEQKLADKEGDESDMKESEHDTSLEEDAATEDRDTSATEEKDTDVSHDGDLDIAAVEVDSLKSVEEEAAETKSKENQSDLFPAEPVPVKPVEEEVMVPKEVKVVQQKPEEATPRKKEVVEEKVVEKDSAPELVAEKPFKEVSKVLGGKTDNTLDEARFEISEAILQMPVLQEVFKKVPEEAAVPETKKPEPMPEIKKVEPEVPKKEVKERGRKLKKDLKEGGGGRRVKAAAATVVEPVVPEPKPAETHPMTPQEARMKAAMDLYDFQGFEEPDEELVLRKDKKSDLLGRRLLTVDKEVKVPDTLESGETEVKKVKKKVKKKAVVVVATEDETKKKGDVKETSSMEMKKECDKKESEAVVVVKKDLSKDSAKGKAVKGDKSAKKETKKAKDKGSDGESAEANKEKKDKRPRSRSSSPVEPVPKVQKVEPASSPASRPSTSVEVIPLVAESPKNMEPVEPEMSVSTTMLDNTPPTTPEHEVQEAEPTMPQRVPETTHVVVGRDGAVQSPAERTSSKLGSESPSIGEASGSSGEGNDGNVAPPHSSESSNDVMVPTTGKRKRDANDQTTNKKKRRASRSVKVVDKKCKGSDSDESPCFKMASPHHVPMPSSPIKMPESVHHIPLNRPPKYNFNLEEGNYLEGEPRIAFLVEKMQVIRKIYMNLKQEVACIDRRRKRAKRKERENSQSSHIDGDSS